MAKQVKLAAQPRTETGRIAVKKIKSEGYVPAVIYSNGEAAVSLKISEQEIDNLLAHAAGEHFLVELAVEGEGSSRSAIVQEVQHHPVSRRILHIDFQGVSADKEIEASIPVEPVGEAIGVKTYGGLLDQLVRSLTVKALPKDLPSVVQVDVSDLNVGTLLHVKEIKLPEGVSIVDDGEIAIFHIAAPRVSATAAAEAKGKK